MRVKIRLGIFGQNYALHFVQNFVYFFLAPLFTHYPTTLHYFFVFSSLFFTQSCSRNYLIIIIIIIIIICFFSHSLVYFIYLFIFLRNSFGS